MFGPYIKGILLTIAIALLGFFFINQLDAMRVAELQNSIDEMLFQSESERLIYLYAQMIENNADALCDYAASATETKASKAYELSQKIYDYENSNVINAEYERIKNQYYLANAALYLNLLSAKRYCGESPYVAVLFFYNVKKDCPSCRAQGAVLDSLGMKYPKMRVFAFPADSGHEFISVFLKRNNVSEVPALVINDETVLNGLQSEKELEKYLGAASVG